MSFRELVMMWRGIAVMVASSSLFIGCGTSELVVAEDGHPVASEGGAEKRSTADVPVDDGTESQDDEWRAAWEPELPQIRRDDTHKLRRRTTLSVCDQGNSCSETASFEPGARIFGAQPSLEGTRVFVSRESEDEVAEIYVFDVESANQLGRCDVSVSPSIVFRPGNGQAVAGEGVIFTWSAGSDVTEALVCSSDGEILAQPGGPTIDISPSREYAVVVPGKGTPQIWKGRIAIYDLVTGQQRRFDDELDETVYVEAIEWREEDVVFSIRTDVDAKEDIDEFVVPLWRR